jgi:hypothetical protein
VLGGRVWCSVGWAFPGPSSGEARGGRAGPAPKEKGFQPTGHAEKRKTFLISKRFIDLQIHFKFKSNLNHE